MTEKQWDLLVSYGDNPRRRTVKWSGKTGEDAARRLVDAQVLRRPTVWAWRKPTGQGEIHVFGRGTIIGCIAAAAITAGLLAGSAYSAPAACAVPGDPMPSCETTGLGVTICDGPIRPDGTWQRCGRSYTATCSGGFCNLPQTVCRIVNPATPDDLWHGYGLGAPPYHID